MTAFRSSEELLAAVGQLAATLERKGQARAAAELREGLRCLNGLTDGWALFLESIDRAMAAELEPPERRTLGAVRAAVDGALHRR